jgi:dTMP kinase
MPALIVSIEGTDFSGKTTIANLLIEILREKNRDRKIIFKRTEVPSNLISGSFTKILRNSADKISSNVFALCYALDHLHHFEKEIVPLKESKEFYVVIQERSLLSTYIYQGIIGDVDFNWLKEINKYDKNFPDLALILKIDIEELLKRKVVENKQFDKFETKEHVEKQTNIYYNIPKDLAKTFNVEYVDANGAPIEVANRCAIRIQKEIDRFLK